MSHLEHYNLLYHLRHGFHTFKSSELQLIELVSDIVDNSHAKQTDVIILDFSKTIGSSTIPLTVHHLCIPPISITTAGITKLL